MHFQIWAGDNAVGDALPLDEALAAFRDQVQMEEDPEDAPPLFLLPPGYRPPDAPRSW